MLVTRRLGRDVTTISSTVIIDPDAELVWSDYTAGDTAALALIADAASVLTILAEQQVLHIAGAYPILRLNPATVCYPFAYAPRDLIVRRRLLDPGVEDDAASSRWVDKAAPAK